MLADHEPIRRLFPGTQDKVFLDAACMSLAPTPAVAAIESFLRDVRLCPEPSATAQHIALDQAREAARLEAARLINARPDEIAIVESTTAGLNSLLPAIPFAEGDNVLVCDLEFLQLTVSLDPLVYARRIELRSVPHRDGIVTSDDFARRCDARTRAIVISSVQWSHGLKLDLAGLSEIAAAHRAWLIVDAIQHLGAAPLDVSQVSVDGLVCGGHKWLNAPFGCGFMYVNGERLATIEPLHRGYLTLQDPVGGWGKYFSTPDITPFRPYHYVAEAKKFETGGTSNYPGAIGLGASLKLINDLGSAAIAAHIQELSNELIEGLRQRGARIITPEDERSRAGIVTFRCFDDPAQDAALADDLARQRVYVSTRYTSGIGGTRVSIHFFNNRDDIDQLLTAVDHYRH